MRIIRFVIPLLTATLAACSYSAKEADEELPQAQESANEYSDLRMFEFKGKVKSAVRETFYNVTLENGEFVVDTTAATRRTVNLYFDELGNYVPSRDELLKRDEQGRLTYWRDRRPNARKVDPGVLRDTLAYEHLSDNVLFSSGMGETAVTVYDNDNRIVGQYSKPDIDGVTMSAFNIYRNQDDQGNWTERSTVWVSNAPGKKPHISYTVDRRTIEYY